MAYQIEKNMATASGNGEALPYADASAWGAPTPGQVREAPGLRLIVPVTREEHGSHIVFQRHADRVRACAERHASDHTIITEK